MSMNLQLKFHFERIYFWNAINIVKKSFLVVI